MQGSILHVLKLIPKVSSQFTQIAIHKSHGIAKILIYKSLEFLFRYGNICTFFKSLAAIVLKSLHIHTVLKKRCCQRGTVIFVGYSCIEMVFTLMTKSLPIYMRFSQKTIVISRLKRWFVGLYRRRKILDVTFYIVYIDLQK